MTLRGSLFRKYTVYFTALVALALSASGGIGVYFTYQENKAALLNLQREKAAAAASRIETYMREIERQILWMRFPQIGARYPDQRRFDYLKLLHHVPAITDVSQLDRNGREQLRVSRLGLDVVNSGEDYSADPKFTVPKGGETYFSPVYFRKETEPYITISIPGINDEAGITVAEVNLKFTWDVISRIKIGQKGLAYAVDARGRLIAHPDISQVLQKSDLSLLPQVKAALKAQDAAAERVSIAHDQQGSKVLTAYASISSLGWHVFVEQPIAEAFAPLYASLERTGLLLLAGLMLAVAASLYLARRMVTPIRAIQSGAAQLGAGNLEQRIEVQTGDELEALASEFNNMATQLNETYANLERKVDERTRELSESLEQQTATSDVLKTISRSSIDLSVVLQELIKTAVKLGRADMGALYIRNATGVYELRTAHSDNAELREFMEDRAREIHPESNTAVGRAVSANRPAQIHDVTREAGYRWPEAKYRTALAVPIAGEDIPVGVIVMTKVMTEPFSEKQIALITTFADQAGIAIENVRLFNEIQEKNLQLELANRHKSEFLAGMSHELRTPLNAIIGFSEVLLERMFGEMNEKQEDYLKDIHSSGQHLLSLINDILDLAKVEAGRMELNLATFDLPTAIDNALTLIRERALRHGIALSVAVDSQLGEISADERKLKQILLNLLSNAVKFTPEGGRIMVGARLLGDMVEIAVNDTGIGIAPEDQAAVFEEFRQVGTDYTRKAEGTGLGLALTRKLVELHGGVMRLESEPGKGSTFAFTLPLNATTQDAPATST